MYVLKAKLFVLIIVVLSLVGFHGHSTEAAPSPSKEKTHCFSRCNDTVIKKYSKEGFSKSEICKAVRLEKYSKSTVHEILTYYEKNEKSWKKTANHFNVDVKKLHKKGNQHTKFWKEHQEEILQSLAQYNNQSVEEIQGYVNDQISLKDLVILSTISKLSQTNVKDHIQSLKDGKTVCDIADQLKIDRKEIKQELHSLKQKYFFNGL